MRIFRDLIILVIVLWMIVMGFKTFIAYLDMPEVHRDWSSKQCVSVDDPAAIHRGQLPYSCTNLPQRYKTIWVGSGAVSK